MKIRGLWSFLIVYPIETIQCMVHIGNLDDVGIEGLQFLTPLCILL